MNFGAQIVSAVANTARGFITDVYRDEIGGIDDEMLASEKRYEPDEEEAEDELEGQNDHNQEDSAAQVLDD